MEEKLTVGEIVNGTFATFAENIRTVAVYITVFSLLGVATEWSLANVGPNMTDTTGLPGPLLDYVGLGTGLFGLVLSIASIVAQYMLWQEMLVRSSYLTQRPPFRILGFIGLAILMGLGTTIGFLLLIVPGFIALARWAVAPAFLIAEGKGIIDSMRSSWGTIQGRTKPVILAILAGIIAYYVLLGGVVGGYMATGGMPTRGGTMGFIIVLITQLTAYGFAALQIALGVFLFKRLHGPGAELSETFA